MLKNIVTFLSGHKYIVGISFLLIAAYLVFINPDSISVGNNSIGNRELPIYSVDTPQKKVALSFDAAWGNENTQVLLSILDKYQLHATFFMTGSWVEIYPDDVKAISLAGHDLGNHSQNHKEMSKLTTSEIQEELMKVHNKVKELTGIEMELFRPPYGDYNNNLIKTVSNLNYVSIQWSVDSLDWKDYGTESIIKTVLENKDLENGAIILMHLGAKYTPQALETIIIELQKSGYEIVPISKLIYKENFYIDQRGRQYKK
ncbi:MAG: polysaccharide deacetylase family protein [Lachnospiraceae bacterium]|mgnify:CR=1 FL=1|jgi:polysaccharide deacetylase family sporulation protein PdaB|nr:polysaccharide deacetylase family protein [Lachnospiraceae bacterium]